MKVFRFYATPSKGININRIVQQLVEIEMEKVVNSSNVNSPMEKLLQVVINLCRPTKL